MNTIINICHGSHYNWSFFYKDISEGQKNEMFVFPWVFVSTSGFYFVLLFAFLLKT